MQQRRMQRVSQTTVVRLNNIEKQCPMNVWILRLMLDWLTWYPSWIRSSRDHSSPSNRRSKDPDNAEYHCLLGEAYLDKMSFNAKRESQAALAIQKNYQRAVEG